MGKEGKNKSAIEDEIQSLKQELEKVPLSDTAKANGLTRKLDGKLEMKKYADAAMLKTASDCDAQMREYHRYPESFDKRQRSQY